MENLRKIAVLEGNDEKPYSHPATYRTELMEGGVEKIVAGVRSSDSKTFLDLTTCLKPPYYLLYVLHTPRGEAAPGRYQSGALSTEELLAFINKYSEYLTSDGRFDLWGHSPNSGGTVVWDRHNLAHAYGPLGEYEVTLKDLGYCLGSPTLDFPHVHYYHSEFDIMAESLHNEFVWSWSPLQPMDEQ